MSKSSPLFDDHNRTQKEYYSGPPKKKMVPSASQYLRRQLSNFLAETDLQPSDQLLEIGCGMGRYTLLLAEQHFQVTGLDLSPTLLGYLENYNAGRFEIPLVCGDIIDDTLDLSNSFDAAIGFFVLHHLHDLAACFSGMGRFVKGGGLIAFLEPNPLNPLYYVQIATSPTMTWAGDKGILQMRPNIIREGMARAGIELQSVKRFGFFPPFVTNRAFGMPLETFFEGLPLITPFLPFQIFIGTKR